jgi:hypothetical protein
MKSQFEIARRELFKKLAGAAGAMSLAALLPSSASAETEPEAASTSTGSATVRVILTTGTTVQWMAVTSGSLTVGGQTTINSGGDGLNNAIKTAAIAAIIAAGGPQLTVKQVILFGGAS